MSKVYESVADMRTALGTNETSATALVQSAIERAEALSDMNLFTELCTDSAMAAAAAFDAGDGPNGPLGGIPVVVKDNINTAESRSSGGCAVLAMRNPAQDATSIARLRAAGAIVLGKTNMHELAFGITSNNPHYGACKNPYDKSKFPGGSSGGTGAAVAARVTALGLGTDTGGSCRIPAALCGCVGFRPSLGRWPADAVVPISATRDTPGPLSLSVDDAILLDAICAADDVEVPQRDPESLRLGVARAGYFQGLDPALEKVTDAALGKLAAAGCQLIEVDISNTMTLGEDAGFVIVFYEVLRDLGYYLARYRPEVSLQAVINGIATPGLADMLQAQLSDQAVPIAAYHDALSRVRPALQAAYANALESNKVDALLVPTTPLPARPIGQEETVELNGEQVPTFPTFIRNTDPASNAGVPAITLPCGLTAEGLPVGLELVGGMNADKQLLAVARAVESVFGSLPAPKLV